jgi:3-deoxy-D-manno-octulosonic-acid transferase
MRHLYSAALYLMLPFLLLRMLWRSRRMPAYRQRLGERFGRGLAPICDGPVIWVHAVSLGETQAAAPLVEALLRSRPHHRILVTTTTPTGSDRVQSLFGERVLHCYAPWDLPGSVSRFLGRVRPQLLLLMETELWPNTIHHCRRTGCRVVLANARLSRRSADGYARFPGLTSAMLLQIDAVACQSAVDGERFVALGLPPPALAITGNLKYDIRYGDQQRAQAARLRSVYRADTRPVLVVASTHPGEEELVLDAWSGLRSRHMDCLLLLAPRHPERANGVEQLCRRRGWRVQRRSLEASPEAACDVMLVDTIGELAVLQSLASVALVGGSLVPRGGHNPLEAAAWGVPLVCGPHMENFADITGQLVEAGAMLRVSTAKLAGVLGDLLADPSRRAAMGAAGKRVVESNRGALERLLPLVEAELAPRRG